MPIQSKTEPAKISASEWQTPGRGLLEEKGLNTGFTLLKEGDTVFAITRATEVSVEKE
jgi:hypothetical protein